MLRLLSVCLLLLCSFTPLSAWAFTADGCGTGTCASCHSLDVKEAGKILGGLVDKVHEVEFMLGSGTGEGRRSS